MEPSFAALVRAWRERALLTQDRLAHRAGLGVRTIRRIEAGEPRRPRGESIRRLADALGLGDADRDRFIRAARSPRPDV